MAKYVFFKFVKVGLLFGFVALLSACSLRQKADLLLYNAHFIDPENPTNEIEGLVIRDGKVLDTGSLQFLRNTYLCNAEKNLNGLWIYPGFQDAHCHFLGYARTLLQADLTGTHSPEEVLEKLKEHQKSFPSEWITGRGWDQNDWVNKSFPDKSMLDSAFPGKPVCLIRVDGHAAWVSSEAMKRAGINESTFVNGGEILKTSSGPTGVLIDNAVDLVKKVIPKNSPESEVKAIQKAQEQCFAVGLTSLTDAGLPKSDLEFLDSLSRCGILKIRLNCMASDDKNTVDWILKKGKIIRPSFRIQSIKVYADGALGSRGACLLEPYSDQEGHYGFLLQRKEYFDSLFNVISKTDFQVNTHCIGDSANRLILKLYKKYLLGKNDRRWRIEHAQVVHPQDIDLFRECSIIPSVQPSHATSDMYWAEERLGNRIANAYTWKSFLKTAGVLPCGSDFPVESIDPIKGFYAATLRKDGNNFPEGGFQFSEALTPEEALKGMTIWAAYAGFSENETGSFRKNTFADFTITNNNLLTSTKSGDCTVKFVYLNGKEVYSK